jgi:hypothetical protein
VLDGVDHALADGHANPVQGFVVEPDASGNVIAHDLDEIQHLEGAGELEADGLVPVEVHGGRLRYIIRHRFVMSSSVT